MAIIEKNGTTIYEKEDMREMIFEGKDLRNTIFKECMMDHSTKFILCDMRHTSFPRTRIELAYVKSCIGNGDEIISMHIDKRVVNGNKLGIRIDCLLVPKEYLIGIVDGSISDQEARDKLFMDTKTNEYGIFSENMVKYYKAIASIWVSHFIKD